MRPDHFRLALTSPFSFEAEMSCTQIATLIHIHYAVGHRSDPNTVYKQESGLVVDGSALSVTLHQCDSPKSYGSKVSCLALFRRD